MEQPTRLSDAQRRRMTGLMGALDTDPNAPGPSALDALSLLFPYGAAARGVMAAPRAVAAGLGGLGLLGGSASLNDAEAQARKGAPAPARPTPEDEALAAKLPDYMRPEFLDLRARARSGALSRVDRTNLDRMHNVIAQSATRAEEATRQEGLLRAQTEAEAARSAGAERQQIRAAELAKAEEARMKAMSDAPKSFAERFPDWNSMQGFMPFAVGAATTLPIAARAAYGANRAATQWRSAVDDGLKATNPVDLAAANNLAQSYAKKFPEAGVGATLKPYAAPAAIGAIEGAAVSNAPEAYNMFLPPENPERKAMMEFIKQLSPDHPARAQAERVLAQLPQGVPARDAAMRHFQSPASVVSRLAIGGLEGAGGAAMATTLAKPFAPSSYGYPRAGTQALSERVAGVGLDDATRAIEAESRAIGTVRPLPPAQAQLPPREPQGLLGPPQPARPPAAAAPEPIPMPTSRLQAELMVNAGLLPPAVLERFPR